MDTAVLGGQLSGKDYPTRYLPVITFVTGISLEFATVMFRAWLEEKDINAVFAALKKSQMDSRLLVRLRFDKSFSI